MKRLWLLAFGVLAAALLLAALDRLATGGPEPSADPESLPLHRAEVEIGSDGMRPHRLRVPKDHRVRLIVRGGPEAPEGILRLAGYGDRAPTVDMGPGLSREMVFESRLPGDDFAFELGGRFLGRLEVTGSHLEEGHR